MILDRILTVVQSMAESALGVLAVITTVLVESPHLVLIGLVVLAVAWLVTAALTAPLDPNPELSRLDLMDRGAL